MILSVIRPPTIVSTTTELAIKYQLSITLTCICGLNAAAASVLIPDSNTSVVTISKLAVKPQPTPAMAASKPATGCLPTARKISAPIGGMITNAASEEMWLKKAINSTI